MNPKSLQTWNERRKQVNTKRFPNCFKGAKLSCLTYIPFEHLSLTELVRPNPAVRLLCLPFVLDSNKFPSQFYSFLMWNF